MHHELILAEDKNKCLGVNGRSALKLESVHKMRKALRCRIARSRTSRLNAESSRVNEEQCKLFIDARKALRHVQSRESVPLTHTESMRQSFRTLPVTIAWSSKNSIFQVAWTGVVS
jgi:uncharacterized protein with von Willebrand factor type A (vWA) domain